MLRWSYQRWLWKALWLALGGAVILAISIGVASVQAEAIQSARAGFRSDSSTPILSAVLFVLNTARQLCYAGAGVCVIFGAVRFGFELAYELSKSRSARGLSNEAPDPPTEPL